MPRWKSRSRPKKHQVSLRRATYEKLKAQAKKDGVTITHLLEGILRDGPTEQEPTAQNDATDVES